MAINKKLIHFNTFENFNSKKLSANAENTQYTLGTEGTVQTGSPDILYQSIVYIKDTKLQWTHGSLYASVTKEELNEKQDTLVSGTNIKTINGESILGEGDITIESGSEQVQPDWNETDTTSPAHIANKPEIVTYDSLYTIIGNEDNPGNIQIFPDGVDLNGAIYINYPIYNNNNDTSLWFSPTGLSLTNEGNLREVLSIVNNGDGTKFLSNDGTYKEISGGSSAYSLVNHGTSDTTFTLTPNTFHVWDEVTALDLDFGTETEGVANEYLFQFTSGATATTLTLPDTIKWVNNETPVINTNQIYLVSIVNNLASILQWNLYTIFPMYLTTEGGVMRDADELSLALADFIVKNISCDGVGSWDCYFSPGCLYIDGHEVNWVNAFNSNCELVPSVLLWYFSDSYDYGYFEPLRYIYISGDDKGKLWRFDGY